MLDCRRFFIKILSIHCGVVNGYQIHNKREPRQHFFNYYMGRQYWSNDYGLNLCIIVDGILTYCSHNRNTRTYNFIVFIFIFKLFFRSLINMINIYKQIHFFKYINVNFFFLFFWKFVTIIYNQIHLILLKLCCYFVYFEHILLYIYISR